MVVNWLRPAGYEQATLGVPLLPHLLLFLINASIFKGGRGMATIINKNNIEKKKIYI